MEQKEKEVLVALNVETLTEIGHGGDGQLKSWSVQIFLETDWQDLVAGQDMNWAKRHDFSEKQS